MKKLITIIIPIVMMSNTLFANCEWASGIKKQETGYLYTNECHGRVGILVQDLEDREKEVEHLRKSLELKDLALDKADQRVMLWRNESYTQFDKLQNQIEIGKKNEMLYFLLGVFVTGTAIWSLNRITH